MITFRGLIYGDACTQEAGLKRPFMMRRMLNLGRKHKQVFALIGGELLRPHEPTHDAVNAEIVFRVATERAVTVFPRHGSKAHAI